MNIMKPIQAITLCLAFFLIMVFLALFNFMESNKGNTKIDKEIENLQAAAKSQYDDIDESNRGSYYIYADGNEWITDRKPVSTAHRISWSFIDPNTGRIQVVGANAQFRLLDPNEIDSLRKEVKIRNAARLRRMNENLGVKN